MKKNAFRLAFILLSMLFTIIALKSNAQSYQRIDYPYVGEGKSTVDHVFIKAITFTQNFTQVDFITCYTGHYIFLSAPNHKDAMYIWMNDKKYKLIQTRGISSKDGITSCQPGQLLEFSAIFEPIPDKDRGNFNLIEGLDGTWNFYDVSISKYLARTRIPDLRAMGQRNWEKVYYKNTNTTRNKPSSNTSKKSVRRKLKKDPNFKID